MNVAIGGYLLMMVASGTFHSIDMIVKVGQIVKAFDSAEECEKAKEKLKVSDTLVCVPALAVINR